MEATQDQAPEREHCPHCNRHIPTDMVADDFSGCPLKVKCAGPAGVLGAADAWPDEGGDGDDAQEVGPVWPAPVPVTA